MGCFSYKCKGCRKSVRGGEESVIYWLQNGDILEVAEGSYDTYGFSDQFGGEDDDNKEWSRKVAGHFDKDRGTGFQAWHTPCRLKAGKKISKTISADDPGQGWGEPRPAFRNAKPLPEGFPWS